MPVGIEWLVVVGLVLIAPIFLWFLACIALIVALPVIAIIDGIIWPWWWLAHKAFPKTIPDPGPMP